MDIFILAGLIMLNGVFAMAEIAVLTAKRGRLQNLSDEGNAAATIAIKLAEEPTRFLSTVQIGITSIGIMNGIYGESVLAEPFSDWLQRIGVKSDVAAPLATALVVIVVTYLSIVIGELVPKRIGQMRAERISCLIAQPMQWLALLAIPFVKLLSVSTRVLLRLLGFGAQADGSITEEDIHAMLLEGSNMGVIERHEHLIVKNVFRFDERPISSLMTPRSEMVYLDVSLPLQDNYRRVMDSPHTNFPVCDQQADNLLGVVNVKDVMAEITKSETVNLKALAKPSIFVLPGLNAMELLQRFRLSDIKMAFIVDEYGDLKGLVTLQDLLEALTGDFYSETEDDAYIVVRDDGSYLLDGLLPVIDVKDLLNLTELPEGSFQTLSGLIMALMDKVPMTGDKFELNQWSFEILDMDGRRIDKVLASRLPAMDGRQEENSNLT